MEVRHDRRAEGERNSLRERERCLGYLHRHRVEHTRTSIYGVRARFGDSDDQPMDWRAPRRSPSLLHDTNIWSPLSVSIGTVTRAEKGRLAMSGSNAGHYWRRQGVGCRVNGVSDDVPGRVMVSGRKVA